MTSQADSPPLIVHIVHRFSVGGLENGLVNLLNRLPRNLARHCVMSLTTADPVFSARVQAGGVEFVELHKRPGQTAWILPAVYQALRQRQPALVHTRNMTTLECQVAACLARVPVRVHGEHGWDVNDLHGSNRKYVRLRRLLRPLVHHQVALSRRTRDYLIADVGVAADQVSELCNGVDVTRFSPPQARVNAFAPDRPWRSAPPVRRFAEDRGGWPARDGFVVGTVGRLASVKNQRLLCEAFLQLRSRSPAFRERGHLLVVGDGPDRASLQTLVDQAGAGQVAWFPGERDGIPQWLGAMDVFCLPSLAEGISNSILEAMACARPVIATRVGGNEELVDAGVTGCLLFEANVTSLADAIDGYFSNPALCVEHGRNGRNRAVTRFSLEAMVGAYQALYSGLLNPRPSGRIPGAGAMPIRSRGQQSAGERSCVE